MAQNIFEEIQGKKQSLLLLAQKAVEYGWIPKQKTSKDDKSATSISYEEIVEKIENDTLTIGVIGQMKCGKSTFLNSFVFGDTILPAASTPMTAALSVITYGEQERIVAEFYTAEEWAEQKQQEARKAVEAVDIIVKAEVVKERERLKKHYDEVYGRYAEGHEREHKKILEGWRTKACFSCYCIIWIMAVLSSQSPLFAADCKEAWKNGLKFLSGAWQQLPDLAEFASGWTVMIPWIPAEICIRFLVYWGTLACSIVMPIIIMILFVKTGSVFYKKQMAGWNSFWAVVIVWLVTIVLAADIKGLLQINLLFINLICHAGFCLWKTVVKKRNAITAADYSWKM